jgi:protein KRI1
MENGAKRKTAFTESSSKRLKLLEDDSEEESAELELKVNQDYAMRFEHNKQRAELHKRKYILPLTWL